jgi:hypothetical protein
MRARTKEKQEVAKGTLLVTFDLLGEEISGPDSTFSSPFPTSATRTKGDCPMAEGVQKALEEAGVQDEKVIAERYSGY